MTYVPPNNYFDRFDKSKNYKKLLFLAGQGLQSAELNELQDFIRSDLALISRYLISDGTVITGGEVSNISSTSITIRSASVYADGVVVEVPMREVPITGTGVEIVGMACKVVMITDHDDPELREPDTDSPNYNLVGSYREQYQGRWAKSTDISGTETFFPIVTLNDGKVVSLVRQTDDSTTAINATLNSYDNETRGSYLLEGLGLNFKEVDASQSIVLNAASGKARVLGVPVSNAYEKTVVLDPIMDTRPSLGEPYVYSGNTYAMRYFPISNVIRVQGTKRVTRTITHGAFSGATDALPDVPVLSVESVTQGGTTYTSPTDFIVVGDNIDWSPAGAEPAPGSTYSVIYRYIATFNATISPDKKSIVIGAGDELVAGTTFYVDYNYSLKRIDRISINSQGQYVVSKGTPGYNVFEAPPKQNNTLSLATVNLVQGEIPVVVSDTTVNVDLNDLNSILTRMSNLETNVATLSLMESAKSTDPTVTKRGTFVDSLRNGAQRDAGSSNTAAIFDEKLVIKSNLVVLDSTKTSVSLPFTEVDFISQSLFTTARKINAYASPSDPILGKMSIIPSTLRTDRWWYEAGDRNTTSAATAVAVAVGFFNAGEVVDVSFQGSTTEVTVNSVGDGVAVLTIPSGTRVGNYQVRCVGRSSGIEAVGILSVVVSYQSPPPPPPPVVNYDPLAQTFIPGIGVDMSSISIRITELPADDILVKFVNVKLGIPDSTDIISFGRIRKSSVVMGWNNIKLEQPLNLNPESEYAVILTTSRSAGSVAVAKMGQRDPEQNKTVTTQPHTGVLLMSANERTWTPIQDEDLTFILKRAKYTSNSLTRDLMTVNATGMSDWMLSGGAFIPDGTTVRFYLEDPSGIQYDIIPNVPLFTPAITGNVKLKVTIATTTDTRSPIIPAGLALLGGTPEKPAIYTSRQIPVPNGSTTAATMKLIIDEFKPGATTIVPQVQKADTTYQALTFVSGTPLGDGWSESVYQLTGFNANATRLRISLDTSNPSVRPQAAKIRLVIS